MKVYVDEVKFDIAKRHTTDLTKVFDQVRKYDMRLNPEKCMFVIERKQVHGVHAYTLRNRGKPR